MVQEISSFSFLRVREFQRIDVRAKSCNNVKMNDVRFLRLRSDKLILQILICYYYPATAHVTFSKINIQFEVRIVDYFSE